MNIRKLLDWRKALIYSHRWLGIGVGIVFVLWCVSGFVLMYYGIPTLKAGERLMRLPPLDLSTVRVAPAEAVRKLGLKDPTRLRISMQKKQRRPGTFSQGVNRRRSRCDVFDCEIFKCHTFSFGFYLLCTGLSPNSQILANDIGIGIDSQSRPLRHGDLTIYRREHAAIELRFEIEVAPLDHRICVAERGRHMDCRQ